MTPPAPTSPAAPHADTSSTGLHQPPLYAAVVASLVLAAGWSTGCSEDRPEPPADAPARRVILIVCDTLRADRLGVYGYDRPTSPEVDAFARECVVFDDAYAATSITGPSMSSLLTGLLPDELSLPNNRWALAPEATTVAELARAAGYRTGAVISNFVLRRPPPELGDAGVSQGFEHFDDDMLSREIVRDLPERLAEDTTDAALAWLERRRAADEDRFFLWVHYQDPHGPYTPPADRANEFASRPPVDARRLPLGRTVRGLGQIPRYQILQGEDRPQVYSDLYDAEIATFDAAFGRLVRWLDEAGWLDDSLVVFTADHGESLGEHDFWFSHGEHLHRDVVHVPLLVRYPTASSGPGHMAPDGHRRVSTPVAHLDLWPTFLTALGLDARPNRGTSLFDEPPPGRTFLHTLRAADGADRWSALTTDGKRIVEPHGGPSRVYAVDADTYETRDLHDIEPATRIRLEEQQRIELASQRAPLRSLPFKHSKQALKALQNLGYTDGDEDEEE